MVLPTSSLDIHSDCLYSILTMGFDDADTSGNRFPPLPGISISPLFFGDFKKGIRRCIGTSQIT